MNKKFKLKCIKASTDVSYSNRLLFVEWEAMCTFMPEVFNVSKLLVPKLLFDSNAEVNNKSKEIE